jgi:hypothetical protein
LKNKKDQWFKIDTLPWIAVHGDEDSRSGPTGDREILIVHRKKQAPRRGATFGETLALALILAAHSLSATSAEQAPATNRKYETCRVQIEKYLEDHFQQTVSRIAFDFVFDYRAAGGGDGAKSAAVVYTNECPGYHVFELFATDFDCDARAHAGKVPNYIYYRTSQDGC